MSEQDMRDTLNALAAELDECIAGCNEIDALLSTILDRPRVGV